MLEKIEGQEIMTIKEAKTKYSDRRMLFIYSDNNIAEYWRDDRTGHVAYIYDKIREQKDIPREAITGLPCAFTAGYKFIEPFSIDRMLGPDD